MSWSGRNFTTCPGRDAVLRQAWSGRSFTACPGWDVVLRQACSGRKFTTYPGWDVVLQHAMVGKHIYDIPLLWTQIYDMSWPLHNDIQMIHVVNTWYPGSNNK